MAGRGQKLVILDKTYSFPEGYDFILDGRMRSPWFDVQCRRRVSPVLIARELEIDYGGSSYQFFEKEIIDELLLETVRPPLYVGDLDYGSESVEPLGLVKSAGGPLKLWCELPAERPPKGMFVLGADVSFGSGASNSVASVVNRDTGEKVAEYATNGVKPSKFAMLCVAMARWFSCPGQPCMMIWESQGPGGEFKSVVIENGYRHFYRQKDESRLLKKETDKPGWGSSKQTKKDLLAEYRRNLATRRFINRCKEALLECEEYEVTDDGVPQHSQALYTDDPTDMGVNHGDRVIADALANKLLQEFKVKEKEQQPIAPDGSFAWRREQWEGKRKQGSGW